MRDEDKDSKHRLRTRADADHSPCQDPPTHPTHTPHTQSQNPQIHKIGISGLGIRVLAVTTTGLSHGAWISRNRIDPVKNSSHHWPAQPSCQPQT